MATILKSGNFISITGIAADVTHNMIFKDSGLKQIKRLEFQGGADDDICIVKYGSATGAVISALSVGDVNVVDRCYFDDGGQFMDIYIDFSDGTFTGAHKLMIELA